MIVLVADSHVSTTRGNAPAFLDMLDRLAEFPADVIFLGDIFDLWVGVKRFEDPAHARFLEWCRAARQTRRIGFIEGNHEFFLCREHGDCFTFCHRKEHRDADGLLFVHGDLINRRDYGYRGLRLLSKNPLTRLGFRCMPGGVRITYAIKKRLNRRTAARAKYLPEDLLESFARRHFAAGVKDIFCGHFHTSFCFDSGRGNCLRIVPAWQNGEVVGLFNPDTRAYRNIPWRDLRDADFRGPA